MRAAAAAGLLLLLPAAAWAAGFAAPNVNTRDEGMAGAAVANQNGPEAAFSNGAALAGSEGLQASFSGAALFLTTTWSDPNSPATSQTISPAAPLPAINLTYGGKLSGVPVALGFSFNIAGGGQVKFPTDWAGRAQVVAVERRIYSFDLVAAVQPIEQVKLSLGGLYFYATDRLQKVLVFGSSEGLADLGGAGGKLSWTAALEAKPLRDVPLKLGFQYRHKADLFLRGQAHLDNVPLSFRPQLLDQPETETLTFPNVVSAGLDFDPTPNLSLMASVTYWRYSFWKAQYFTGDKGLVIKLPFDFGNASTWRLGAEYRNVVKDLTLRCGVLRDLTPQPTTTLSPASPGADKWAFSAGVGYEFTPSISADFAYEVSPFDQVQTSGTEAFPGRYDTHANIFSFGVSYRMK